MKKRILWVKSDFLASRLKAHPWKKVVLLGQSKKTSILSMSETSTLWSDCTFASVCIPLLLYILRIFCHIANVLAAYIVLSNDLSV